MLGGGDGGRGGGGSEWGFKLALAKQWPADGGPEGSGGRDVWDARGEPVVGGERGIFEAGIVGDARAKVDGRVGGVEGVVGVDVFVGVGAEDGGDDAGDGHRAGAFEEEVDLGVVDVLTGGGAVDAGGGEEGGADEAHHDQQTDHHDERAARPFSEESKGAGGGLWLAHVLVQLQDVSQKVRTGMASERINPIVQAESDDRAIIQTPSKHHQDTVASLR